MPRGVYDRTKTKAQREAEKTSAAKGAKAPKKATKAVAKATKAAPTKKAEQPVEKAQALATKVSTSPKLATNELDTHSKFAIIRDNISTLALAVQGLTSGTQTVVNYPVGGVLTLLDGELKANIEVLSNLRREVFGLSETEKEADVVVEAANASEAPDEEETDDTEGEDEDEAPAVVAASQPYPQGTVPMPPAPVGVPPQ